jgi:hypothetical protein
VFGVRERPAPVSSAPKQLSAMSIVRVVNGVYSLAFGGTAVGTGINANLPMQLPRKSANLPVFHHRPVRVEHPECCRPFRERAPSFCRLPIRYVLEHAVSAQ